MVVRAVTWGSGSMLFGRTLFALIRGNFTGRKLRCADQKSNMGHGCGYFYVHNGIEEALIEALDETGNEVNRTV